ncbi:MAG: arginine--tRNA ligase [Gammaproteobacteria bacterium]|nr:arginine--tRNA ligase [Gammaproteobacteria bacterium]
MKQQLAQLLARALADESVTVTLPSRPQAGEIRVDRTRDSRHGDFASNVAMLLARAAGTNPRALAERIIAALPHSPLVERAEVAGPGFINFFLRRDAVLDTVTRVLDAGERYGCSDTGAGRRLQVEFVSANPTGPLHIGHGRGAAYGAVVANLLAAVGFDVCREYYINDAGRQMDILALSVWLRYLQAAGAEVPFPDNVYKGAYVVDIARALRERYGQSHQVGDLRPLFDAAAGHDAETTVDRLVGAARELLGAPAYREVFDFGLDSVLAGIKADLGAFGVTYDVWYSERSLAVRGAVERAIERLDAAGALYTRDGARWFRSSDFGDEKDRVVVRENGQSTYFAADVAYHLDKIERGFEQVINVWGADHHGYVPRLKAALQALGHDPDRLEVRLVQFATLFRGGERVQMSTRSGEFITLAELCQEVGMDAARYYYVARKADQHLEFDLDLAKSQSADNPVYYVQYAHARVCSVFRQLADKGLAWDPGRGRVALDALAEPHEQDLIASLGRYPEVVATAALNREPHQLAHFLRDLANELHVYYGAHKFLVEDDTLRDARLNLIAAVRQVIANGLRLLGVRAPETM